MWKNYCGTVTTIATEVLVVANYGSESNAVIGGGELKKEGEMEGRRQVGRGS